MEGHYLPDIEYSVVMTQGDSVSSPARSRGPQHWVQQPSRRARGILEWEQVCWPLRADSCLSIGFISFYTINTLEREREEVERKRIRSKRLHEHKGLGAQ